MHWLWMMVSLCIFKCFLACISISYLPFATHSLTRWYFLYFSSPLMSNGLYLVHALGHTASNTILWFLLSCISSSYNYLFHDWYRFPRVFGFQTPAVHPAVINSGSSTSLKYLITPAVPYCYWWQFSCTLNPCKGSVILYCVRVCCIIPVLMNTIFWQHIFKNY